MEGHIQIMIYQSPESYSSDSPEMIQRFSKDDLKEGKLTIRLKLEPGTYGVILMDDDIDSEVMEFNILGLPKKGYGFAGYDHRGIRRPKYEDFCFEIGSQVVLKEVRMRYF